MINIHMFHKYIYIYSCLLEKKYIFVKILGGSIVKLILQEGMRCKSAAVPAAVSSTKKFLFLQATVYLGMGRQQK